MSEIQIICSSGQNSLQMSFGLGLSIKIQRCFYEIFGLGYK